MHSHEEKSTAITRLPPELLTEIFRIATDNPVRDIDSLASWTPFEGSHASSEREACTASLRIKNALSLVCRLFRKLMVQFLYEDIWIRHGSDGLREVFEMSMGEEEDVDGMGYGRFVRRATIPPGVSLGSGMSYNTILEDARAILSYCPYVRVICRPPQETLEGQVECIDGIPSLNNLDFLYLTRVEWHNDSINATAPTPSIFLFSRSLRVLILGPDNFPSRRNENEYHDRPETVISLPNLHTLSIQSIDAFGEPPRQYTVDFPSLRHLILKRPEAMFNLFDGALTPLSRQITYLEAASDFRFLRQDFISTLLGYCTNVSDLYIPVFATRAPHENSIPRVLLEFTSVKRVYLHAGLPNGYVYGQQAWWSMLESHFDGLCGRNSRFVSLERIILAGIEWMESVGNERFVYALRRVEDKGIELVSNAVEVQRALTSVMEASSQLQD